MVILKNIWGGGLIIGAKQRAKAARELGRAKRKQTITQIISNCDATTDWSINNGIGITLGINTSDKQEGTGSLYNSIVGTADASGILRYIYDPAAVINLTGKEFIEFWIKSSVTCNLYCEIADNSGHYIDWLGDSSSRFLISVNTWTKFVLPLLAPAGTTGSLPDSVTGTLNLANINYILIGTRNLAALQVCSLYIDDLKATVDIWS